jgi:hypothetical protein
VKSFLWLLCQHWLKLERLGVEVVPSALESDYNVGKTTQVPTGRMIAIRGRVNRKIGYGGAYVSYEPAPKV